MKYLIILTSLLCSFLTFALSKDQFLNTYKNAEVFSQTFDKVTINYTKKDGSSALKGINVSDMSEDLRNYLNIGNKYVDQKTNGQNDLAPTSNYQSSTTAVNNDNGERINRSSQSTLSDNNGIIGRTSTGKTIYEGPRGGHYHYSASGKKVYEKKKK